MMQRSGLPPLLNDTLTKQSNVGIELVYDLFSDEIQSQLPVDILLITTNDFGYDACYSYIEDVRRGTFQLGCIDFGRLSDKNDRNDKEDDDVRVALMLVSGRWQKKFVAKAVVRVAAKILNPKVVLFVGTCRSMELTKAKLGDVVISTRVGVKHMVKNLDTEANAHQNICPLILSAADGWIPPLKDPTSLKIKVHRDVVILDERQELFNYYNEGLALDEDADLYADAVDYEIEWAVIKGVSGCVDESKETTETWQKFASVMAASIVYNMFKYSVVLEDWPRFQKEGRTKDDDPPNAKYPKKLPPISSLESALKRLEVESASFEIGKFEVHVEFLPERYRNIGQFVNAILRELYVFAGKVQNGKLMSKKLANYFPLNVLFC